MTDNDLLQQIGILIDQKLDEKLDPIKSQIAQLQKGQDKLVPQVAQLQKGQERLQSTLDTHRQESKKDHEELGELISGLADHTDREIAAHQRLRS
jgi:hypothetical protein